jgi:hypothetical protein
MSLLQALAVIVSSATFLWADAANMSGTWSLNVKRSTWGDKPSPTRVDLVIEHNEPAFKYSGTTQAPDERGPTKFEFAGAIDGKDYAVKEDGSTGRKARFRRISGNVIEGIYTGPDGKTAETTKLTLARDSKTLSRETRIKLPDGRESKWTEVYEKEK